MNYYLFSVVLLFVQTGALAASRVRITPMNLSMVANVTEKDMYGNMDSDPIDLYALMDVEEQDSSMGKGKSIVTESRDFNLVCAKEKRACSIVLNKSPRNKLNAKSARFEISGEEAGTITRQFKLNDRGEAYFKASDAVWYLFGTGDSFIFEAHTTFP